MKYVEEYRDPDRARASIAAIERAATRPWVLMEVCGGQTHAIVRHGLDRLLPGIELVHGPGCPVCVTPLAAIDRAHALARRPDVIFASFGDMLRVPGSRTDLLRLRSQGARVAIVYSPLDAVELARRNPDRQVVFFAIGFETTAPANATALLLARREGLRNFTMLVSQVLTPPSVAAIAQAHGNRVQAFLAPGHACTVTGTRPWEALVGRYRVPVVVTGFEPIDLLDGILRAVRQLEAGRAEVENAYARAVTAEGNPAARAVVHEVFEVADQTWRGIGTIPKSGYRIRWEHRDHDALARFELGAVADEEEPSVCISGRVLRGLARPPECPAFGAACTPRTPLGATMVSSEGACAAYFRYGRAS